MLPFWLAVLLLALPRVKYGALFYRQLERCKITALRQHKGDYKKKFILTTGAMTDVQIKIKIKIKFDLI